MIFVTKYVFSCYLLFILINVTYSQTCNYVKNLKVSYRTTESTDWKEITVNGCLDKDTLQNTNINELNIECKNQQLTQIGQNFLRNVESLEKLWISGCAFETINPGAFGHLPKLTEVIITRNSLKEIRKGVFDALPGLTDIHLHFNEISYIDDDAFANLPNLKFIDINDNKCEYMRKEWFTNSTSTITIFYMARNALRQIPPRMFEGWRKLEWFNLNTNEISVIHENAFKDIAPVIKNLDFHLNRLTSISKKSFSDPFHIQVLRLSANLFNYFPEDFIKDATIDYLYVHGNPFKCGCLDQLHSFLHQKGGVILDDSSDPYFYKPCYSALAPVCVVPSKFPRFCQEAVDPDTTRTYLTYLKTIGYDHLEEKCANFDVLTI